MDRRTWVIGSLGLLVAPLAVDAQQAGRISRIGFLSLGSSADPLILARFKTFQEGLRELGYVEGQNITIESRWADGRRDQLRGLAVELVRLKADVIVATGVPVVQAAQQATGSIPIVIAGAIDRVATGFAATRARPGGNITGLSLMMPELVGKQLEILEELVPKVSRVAVLGNPLNAGTAHQLRSAQDAARTLGLRLQAVDAPTKSTSPSWR